MPVTSSPPADRSLSFWRSYGPGLLWAAAAIGVSHLVQATRAGAEAGFALWGVVLLALVLKYPFFEFGPRYAAATGQSLVEGYHDLGRWALWLYLGITVGTALVVQVAVILFTSFLLRHALQLTVPLAVVAAGLMVLCTAVLAVGRFRALDLVTKVVLVLLAVSTLVAAGVAVPRADMATLMPWPLAGRGVVTFGFLLALVGWMPSAIDIAVWSSLWTLAKDRAAGGRTSLPTALLDFRVGYLGTGLLAFAFLALGASVMHGAGVVFSDQGTLFSVQLVDLYTAALGSWTRPVVLIAVLTTMISTSLTVMDGFPRAVARSVAVLRRVDASNADQSRTYWMTLALLAALTVVVLVRFLGSLTAMVDFATVLSFLTAPVLGYLNLRVVTGPGMPVAGRPGPALRRLALVGLVLLGGTAVVYLVLLMG